MTFSGDYAPLAMYLGQYLPPALGRRQSAQGRSSTKCIYQILCLNRAVRNQHRLRGGRAHLRTYRTKHFSQAGVAGDKPGASQSGREVHRINKVASAAQAPLQLIEPRQAVHRRGRSVRTRKGCVEPELTPLRSSQPGSNVAQVVDLFDTPPITNVM